jgi:hypothetical protein
MKKNNKKGFFVIETLVVITIVLTVLTIFYRQIATLYNNFEASINYDTVEAIHAANNVKQFLFQENINGMREVLGANLMLDITNHTFANQVYFDNLRDTLNIEKIYFTQYDINSIIDNISMYDFNTLFANYLQTLRVTGGVDTTSYNRVIVVLENNIYTNIVIDTTTGIFRPVILLLGGSSVTTLVGLDYFDLGAVAYDDADGDITDKITVTSNIDINTAGTYLVKYNVTNNAGHAATEVEREVTVLTFPPELPGTFTSPVATVPRNAIITVSWGATSIWGTPNTNPNYRLEVQYDSGAWNLVANTGTTNSSQHTLSGSANTVKYRVRAESDAGTTNWVESSTVDLYTLTYTFTNASATGRIGPTQSQVNTAYSGTLLQGLVTSTNGIQSITIPFTGTYRIEVWGAQGGGNAGANYGKGARMRGDFYLAEGAGLRVIVGQMGLFTSGGSGGGGGGSFVTLANNTPLIIAGGGGGQYTSSSSIHQAHGRILTSGGTAQAGYPGGDNGNGGAGNTNNGAGGGGGLLTNGGTGTWGGGGLAFVNGGTGGQSTQGNYIHGGFGGGGATHGSTGGGGGGGGYSGGGGGYHSDTQGAGGGGGSFNNGTNPSNTAGIRDGHGQVIFTLITP